MAYCDHKTTNTCPDCVEELIALRKEVKKLREYKLKPYPTITKTCEPCRGFGMVANNICPACGGTGEFQNPAQ